MEVMRIKVSGKSKINRQLEGLIRKYGYHVLQEVLHDIDLQERLYGGDLPFRIKVPKIGKSVRLGSSATSRVIRFLLERFEIDYWYSESRSTYIFNLELRTHQKMKDSLIRGPNRIGLS